MLGMMSCGALPLSIIPEEACPGRVCVPEPSSPLVLMPAAATAALSPRSSDSAHDPVSEFLREEVLLSAAEDCPPGVPSMMGVMGWDSGAREGGVTGRSSGVSIAMLLPASTKLLSRLVIPTGVALGLGAGLAGAEEMMLVSSLSAGWCFLGSRGRCRLGKDCSRDASTVASSARK